MTKPRKPTFAEIVDEVKATEREPDGRNIVRPGKFNLAGRLFDPNGVALERGEELTPAEARAAVAAGALVAFEGCGCGGWGGCQPSWHSGVEFTKRPPRLARHSSPTWLELWRGDGVEVVFAHGDVEWGTIGG